MTIPLFSPGRFPQRLLLLALPAGLLLMSGCRRAEIRTYLAPKEVPFNVPAPGGTAAAGHDHAHEAEPPSAAPAAAPPQAPEMPAISYTAPEDWRKVPAGGSGTQFLCPTPQGEAAVGITALPSLQGRETMLVGMWRDTFKLPPLSEEEAAKTLLPVEIAGQQGQLFETVGTGRTGQPVRLITAFLHHDGKSWFFKLEGVPDAVETQKAAFLAFLKTVKF